MTSIETKYGISRIVISSIMGHSGGGMFPLTMFPAYRRLMRVILDTGTTNFAKSSTYKKHKGNFFLYKPWTWKYIQRFWSNGLLNAYGLTNPGVAANARAIALAREAGYSVIPNFYPQFAKGRDLAIKETVLAVAKYKSCLVGKFYQGFSVLELNLSCPNAKEKIQENMEDALACVKAIRAACPDLRLIGKISIMHPHEFAQELINAGVDIIHSINSIPYVLVCPQGPPSPLQAVGGGGVSGGPAYRLAFKYNKRLRQRIKAPIIMGCGVMYPENAEGYFDIGADAVSLCSVCRLDPKEAIKIIKLYA